MLGFILGLGLVLVLGFRLVLGPGSGQLRVGLGCCLGFYYCLV